MRLNWRSVPLLGVIAVTLGTNAASASSNSLALSEHDYLEHVSPANGTAILSTSPTLKWAGFPASATYEYCIDTVDNGTCDAVWTATGTDKSVKVGGLSPETTYYWQVRADGSIYAEGNPAAFWSFTTPMAPGAGPTSPLYVLGFGDNTIRVLQGTAVTDSWTTIAATNGGYESAFVVTDVIRTVGTWIVGSSYQKHSVSYSLAGAFLGAVPVNSAMSENVEIDGTTDGTHNYAALYISGRVHRYDADWNNQTFLIASTAAASGVTHDPSNNSLWVSSGSYSNAWVLRNYSMTGVIFSSFALSGSGRATGLALDPADSTLWVVRSDLQGNAGDGVVLQQYSKQGTLLGWIKHENFDANLMSAEFTRPPAAPEAFYKVSPTNWATGKPSAVLLNWSASAGAIGFEYCIDTTNDNNCHGWINAGTSTSVAPSGLMDGTTYFWQVRAIHPEGTTYADGSAMASWRFTTGASAFGQVDTPMQNAAGVQGAIGVTGWALDDIGVTKVEIFRNCLGFEPGNCQTVLGHTVVYIGDAAFLPGARPDVEAAFPTYPNRDRAGWGYLMLTPTLPHVTNSQQVGGQGPLTLYAIATDTNGNKTLLGRSADPSDPTYATPTSITMTNDTIAKPFGTLDTPGPGETVVGVLRNFGWALTPDSNTVGGEGGDILIPTSGSTMMVFIDGIHWGFVAYNQCRGSVGNPVPGGVYCNDDVANIFGNPTPQPLFTTRTSNPTKFRNLDAGRGAIGVYQFDAGETLTEGFHTIAWSVTDSQGRTEGIGSRFFIVSYGAGLSVLDLPTTAPAHSLGHTARLAALAPETNGVAGRTGFDIGAPWIPMRARDDGTFAVRLPELGRLELWLGGNVGAGYLVANDTLRPLPVGASLSGSRFAWMPPPGYTGSYRLAFVRDGKRLDVIVRIVEKPPAADATPQIRMHLAPLVQTARSLRVEGWAFDPHAAIGSGIAAVHVWATRIDGNDATPFFVGAAMLDRARPELARTVAGAPSHPGYSLTASLKPGTYIVTAYAWNERTSRWEDARSVTAVVK